MEGRSEKQNISAEQYREATFKLIESLAVDGGKSKAYAAAQAAASDAKLSAAEQFTAKLICAGMDVSDM